MQEEVCPASSCLFQDPNQPLVVQSPQSYHPTKEGPGPKTPMSYNPLTQSMSLDPTGQSYPSSVIDKDPITS